jgi:hypothetical protein
VTRPILKTWHVEQFVVASMLAAVTMAAGSHAIEWAGSLAVLLTFGHAQVGDRLAEADAARRDPSVSCARWQSRYWVGKELIWFAYFALHQSWAAVVGAFVFALYPIWRGVWRRYHPRGVV